jgi:hypothetical protein
MTQQRPESGYRGALPPRQDALARPWVIIVIALFVLMFALAFLGFPSRLVPEATPTPRPSVVPSASVAPSASGSESASASESGSASASASPSPSASAAASQ